ncbi:MAG: ABC transporter ATP-binding protein [Bacilli bacterium]|nr:ABC transporter ATP-binding protein [Bacilli bacterium]
MGLLSVDNLIVKVGGDKIINEMSFSFYYNDIVAILSPNNCGKTTLIKALSGVLVANSGNICVNDIPLNKRNFKKYVLNIGTVFEDLDRQFLCDTVREELLFPLIHLNFNKKEIDKRINMISSIVKIDDILDKEIDKLSNVEKVKVLIGASIIHFPKVLLLDDVFKKLRDREKKEIFNILEDIRKELELGILFTTSDINDVIGLNHIIVLYDGKNSLEGDFDVLIKQDNELSKMGFEIPIMIDLSRKLQFYDLLDDIYYDVDKVVNKLWK